MNFIETVSSACTLPTEAVAAQNRMGDYSRAGQIDGLPAKNQGRFTSQSFTDFSGIRTRCGDLRGLNSYFSEMKLKP